MKVWTSTGFHGHWPVGTSAVVVAETAEVAAEMLADELKRAGLGQLIDVRDLNEIDVTAPSCAILNDGNY